MGYTLTKTTPAVTPVLQQTAFSIKLTVTSDDAELFPVKVFVMEKAVDLEEAAVFACVASPVQILDYPEDVAGPPVDGVIKPYFRLDVVTIVSRAGTKLQNFIDRVQEELDILEANLVAFNSLSNP